MIERKPLPLFLLAMSLVAIPPSLHAQENGSAPDVKARQITHDFVHKTYFFHNTSQQNDENEILVALRNMLNPATKIFLVNSQDAIEIDASPDDQALAQKIIDELDRVKKTYRVTYTLTEEDNGKRVGTQHYSVVVAQGQRTTMKQGSKIPVATGSYSPTGSDANGSGVQTQFTYLDIGMNFDTTVDAVQNGARLKAKIEQSSVGDEKTIAGVNEPVVRQTVWEGISLLTLGKPIVLGSVDVTGTTRRIEIEALLEEVH